MYISKTLLGYVKDTYRKVKSNLFITDLEKILISEVDNDELEFEYYLNKKLSFNLRRLIQEWEKKEYSEKMFISENNILIPLIVDDPTEYSAQMIFPIYHNNKLDGLVIFFRLRGNYIKSSSKAPSTMRMFIEEFSQDNFKVKGE